MRLNGDRMIETLAAMRDATEIVPLRAEAMRALSLCGIERAYFVAPLTRDRRVGRILTNIGFPRVWERHYRARLHAVDPLPGEALKRANAFRWPEDVDETALAEDERRYMQIAAQYGHGRIIGTACYGPQGRAGFLGAGWDGPDAASERVLMAVHQIGQVSFQSYCQIVRGDDEVPVLSNRELEVLAMMVQGATNPDIAQALGISRSSVDAYIRRIFAKLDVTDRTAASVKAYSLGLVATEEISRLVARAREQNEN